MFCYRYSVVLTLNKINVLTLEYSGVAKYAALGGKHFFAPPPTKTVEFEVKFKRIWFFYDNNKAQ